MELERRTFLGHVEVEGGIILIFDPGYLQVARPEDYTHICTSLEQAPQCCMEVNLGGLSGAAVLTGDGRYPVYGIWKGVMLYKLVVLFQDDTEFGDIPRRKCHHAYADAPR